MFAADTKQDIPPMKFNSLIVLQLFLLSGTTSAQDRLPGELPNRAVAKRLADSGSTDQRQADNLNAIRQGSRAFVAAFNQGDAKTVASLWTGDGEYIDEAGKRFAGRAAIEEEYARFFAAHPGVKIEIAIDSLRLISADAAIEDGRAILDPAPASAPAVSKYTAVHVKSGGQWLMSTVRDTRVDTPSGYHKSG
jgi:uncharacterized protein (TIGR02246 family)